MTAKSAGGPQLLVCIINGKEFLDYLLEAYLEIGISGATVIQSQGMGRILVRDFPLFAGFKELLETGGPFNYTVFSVVHDPALVERVKHLIPNLTTGEDSKGVLFTLPVSQFFKFEDLPGWHHGNPNGH